MMFLPNDPYTQARCRHITETVLQEHKLFVFGWRTVPVNTAVLGEKALRTCPTIEQVLVRAARPFRDERRRIRARALSQPQRN